MGNIINNRLAAVITDAERDAIQQNIKQIEDDLPFLKGLLPRERQIMPKINDANRVFVEKVLEVLPDNRELLPSFVNVDKLLQDFALYEQLSKILVDLDRLHKSIVDTRTLAGSQSYMTSLAAYRMLQGAAAAGVPGAIALVNYLKGRFMGQGPSSNNEEDSEESNEGNIEGAE